MKAPRTLAASLALSASVLVGIALNEGYTDHAVRPVQGDVPTIGFGTTEGVRIGDKTTPPRALVRLLQDADKTAQAVRRCAPVPMHQYEFDAFVSLAYNIGPTAFCKSTLVKELKAGNYADACGQILRWTYFQGKDCAAPENARLCGGLAARRQREFFMCDGGQYGK